MNQFSCSATRLGDQKKNEYDTFVAVNGGSFLQSWEWGQWQTALGYKVSRYFVSDDNDILLSVQLIRYSLPLGHCYLYCPYGPVLNRKLRIAEPTADRTDCGLALENLIKQIHADNPVALFIRLEPQTELPELRANGYKLKTTKNIQPGSSIVLDISRTEDELLLGMHSKTRYSIRVSQKHRLTIKILDTEEEFVTAATMFVDTLKRRKLAVQSQKYFVQVINFFKNKQKSLEMLPYGIFYEKNLAACAVIVDFHNTRTYLYGGSSREHKNVMATYSLHWRAIQDAKAKNLTVYDWYGAESSSGKEAGFVRFKLRFGGTVVQYAGARDIVFQPLKYNLYKLIRNFNRVRKHL